MKKTKLLYMLLPVLLLGNSTFKTSKGNEIILPFATNTTLKANSTTTDTKKDDSNFKYEFISNQKFDIDPSDKYEHQGYTSSFNIDARSINLSNYNDSKEDNDSFQNATPLYKVGDDEHGVGEHSVSCEATISEKKTSKFPWAKRYIDKDFYSFDAISNGNLKFTLSNIPENCDFDLRVYKQEDSISSDVRHMNFDNFITQSIFGTDTREVYIDSTPGTYFACIYSFMDKTFDNDHPYKLTITETPGDSIMKNGIFNISEGKSSGDIGAIWTSNYKPFGQQLMSLSDHHTEMSITNRDNYPFINHLTQKYNSQENALTYAVLYIWDLKAKAIISQMASELIKMVNAQTDWDNNAQRDVDISVESSNLVLVVGGIAVAHLAASAIAQSLGTILPHLGIAIEITSLLISLCTFSSVLTANTKFISTKKDLICYLTGVHEAFSIGKGSNDDEVKMLRFRYRFENTNDKCTMLWNPYYLYNDYSFYNKDEISYMNEDSPIDGRVVGLSSIDKLRDILGIKHE